MLQITDTGMVIEPLAAIHQRLTDGFRRIYGDDINIDADTPDGQMIGLFSQELANLNQAIAFMAQMLDPYQATGAWLEQRTLYAGIVRRGAQHSWLEEVIITGHAGVTLPVGTVFSDDNRARWVLETPLTLNDLGSARTRLRSEMSGAFPLPAHAPLHMDTVTVGVDKVESIAPASVGREEETDGQLLTRFMHSHAINNHDDREGIRAALLAVADVQQAAVLENDQPETDPKTGVPGHTLNAVVIGGRDEDIARTLLKKKMGGCGMMGAIAVTIDMAGLPRIARFDRARTVNVKIGLEIERLAAFQDIDIAGIKAALAATPFSIGEPVYAMRLTCQVNSVPGFVIRAITVNGGAKADIGLRECARITPDDVEVLIA